MSARRFVAAFPPDEVLDLLDDLERPEREGVKWSRREQWHVTLRFLGNVELAPVVAALDGVGSAPVEATLGPAVARLGRGVLQVPVAGLDELAADVVARTRDLGRPPEDRPFVGHLTLARLSGRPPKGVTGRPISATFVVDTVHVVSSHLSSGPARYEIEASISL